MAARKEAPASGRGAARSKAIRGEVEAFNRDRPAVERATSIRIARMMLPFVLIVLAIAVAAQMQGATGITLMLVTLSVLIGFGLKRLVLKPLGDLRERNCERLLPVIYSQIEEFHYSHDETPDVMPWLHKIDLVPFDTSLHGSTITGRHDGTAFTLSETELLADDERREHTLFEGTLFHFRREVFFPGTFIAQSKVDPGAADLFPDGSLVDIGLSGPHAEAGLRVRSTSPEAARTVLKGRFGDILTWLASAWPETGWSLALSNHDCYLFIPSQTRIFALPPIGRDIDVERDVRPMTEEMAVFLTLMKSVRNLRRRT